MSISSDFLFYFALSPFVVIYKNYQAYQKIDNVVFVRPDNQAVYIGLL